MPPHISTRIGTRAMARPANGAMAPMAAMENDVLHIRSARLAPNSAIQWVTQKVKEYMARP